MRAFFFCPGRSQKAGYVPLESFLLAGIDGIVRHNYNNIIRKRYLQQMALTGSSAGVPI